MKLETWLTQQIDEHRDTANVFKAEAEAQDSRMRMMFDEGYLSALEVVQGDIEAWKTIEAETCRMLEDGKIRSG